MKLHKKLLKLVGYSKNHQPLIEDVFKEPRGPHDYYQGVTQCAYWFTEMKAFQWKKWSYLGICPRTNLVIRLEVRNNYSHQLDHREVDVEKVYETRGWDFEPKEVQDAYKKWLLDKEAEKAIFG